MDPGTEDSAAPINSPERQSAFWTWPFSLQIGVVGQIAIVLTGFVDGIFRPDIPYSLMVALGAGKIGFWAAVYRLLIEGTATRPNRTAVTQTLLGLLLCTMAPLTAGLIFVLVYILPRFI